MSDYMHTVEPKSAIDTYEGFVITSDGFTFNTNDIAAVYPNGYVLEDYQEQDAKMSDLLYFDVELNEEHDITIEMGIDDTEPGLWVKLLNMVQPT